MTDKPHVTMSPDELALELLTTSQCMSGGRAEAERLLKQVKDRHAHQLAEQIRNRDYNPGAVEPVHLTAQADADSIDPEAQR